MTSSESFPLLVSSCYMQQSGSMMQSPIPSTAGNSVAALLSSSACCQTASLRTSGWHSFLQVGRPSFFRPNKQHQSTEGVGWLGD